jgi:hypothetical protein
MPSAWQLPMAHGAGQPTRHCLEPGPPLGEHPSAEHIFQENGIGETIETIFHADDIEQK